MADVRSLLANKGNQVFTISPNATVLDAALLMNEHKIGAAVVHENDEIKGIFTERDVLQRVVAARRDPAQTRIADVMTTNPIVCEQDTSIADARNIFRSKRIRHLPVVDGEGRLKGMISIGDINAYELNGQETTIHYLEEYIYGRV
jgi:CBS domain-containing protein